MPLVIVALNDCDAWLQTAVTFTPAGSRTLTLGDMIQLELEPTTQLFDGSCSTTRPPVEMPPATTNDTFTEVIMPGTPCVELNDASEIEPRRSKPTVPLVSPSIRPPFESRVCNVMLDVERAEGGVVTAATRNVTLELAGMTCVT